MEHFGAALALVLDPYVLAVIGASALYGLFIGAIPGLTATMATALLVPVTFFMPPVPAVAAIVTATAMAIFSGDIPGALMRIPGTPASAAYADEAYAMTRKGQAELVLGAGLVFSVIGGLFVSAAWTLDPHQAGGMDVAFRTLLQQPFGRTLAIAAALALMAFGVYGLAEARYRRV